MVKPNLENIMQEIAHLQQRLANLIDAGYTTGWHDTGTIAKGGWSPPVDVLEDHAQVTLFIDVPGVVREDIKLQIKENILLLSGQRKYNKEDPEAVFRFERPCGAFKREVVLPSRVDEERIEAELSNGVLIVKMPLLQAKGGHEIEVK